jgi:hypothetical protein
MLKNIFFNMYSEKFRYGQGDQIVRIFSLWQLFTFWAVSLKMTEVAQNLVFSLTLYVGKMYASIVTKMEWATFRLVFSKTHLVTLDTGLHKMITAACN